MLRATSAIFRSARPRYMHVPVRNMSALYTAISTATQGGRDGKVTSTEGFEAVMKLPKGLGGPGNADGSVNPEILFASGYSACFLGAVHAAARGRKVSVPKGSTVTAEVSILKPGDSFQLAVKLNVGEMNSIILFICLHNPTIKVDLAGLDKEIAKQIVDDAHLKICPYSHATRSNVDVQINIL
ncbi:hypothetical protein HK098_001698 [Nowakowskiella sp. JEL0407]|nr:hypothetical protein HK098_001698 [Nowakowskiella sp. JEL0407]